MMKAILLKRNFQLYKDEYIDYVSDIINHPLVRSMGSYIQHGDINCLEHSIRVSYNSYLICRYLGFDYSSAARGGLLHDFFLYDWHKGERPFKGLHGPKHPQIALKNAKAHFALNKREQDIISKHMWPLTIAFPRYKETCIIIIVDKYCSILEIFNLCNKESINKILCI